MARKAQGISELADSEVEELLMQTKHFLTLFGKSLKTAEMRAKRSPKILLEWEEKVHDLLALIRRISREVSQRRGYGQPKSS